MPRELVKARAHDWGGMPQVWFLLVSGEAQQGWIMVIPVGVEDSQSTWSMRFCKYFRQF